MSSKNRQRGKRNQKAIAGLLDGLNIGTLGGTDVLVDMKYCIECKSMNQYPKWFSKMWNQSVSNTKKGGISIIQLHITSAEHIKEDLIVMPLWHFKALIEGGDR